MAVWRAADTVTPDGHARDGATAIPLADDRGPAVQKRLVFVARALSHPQVLTLARTARRVMVSWSFGSRPALVSPFRAAASLTGP